jgi:hypothetical protein
MGQKTVKNRFFGVLCAPQQAAKLSFFYYGTPRDKHKQTAP